MKKQSFITILLTVLMSLTGAKTFAHDIEAVNNDGVTIYYVWANEAKTELAVSYLGSDYHAYSDSYTGNVVIPKSVDYNGKPYPVTSIGSYAFYGSKLTSVTIPNSVTSIGWGAFSSTGLTSITIPNSVISISNNAFWGCSSLTSVNILDLAAWCNIMFSGYESNPLYYAHHLYINGNEITNLVIPSSVTSISGYAFSGCTSLTSVTIPNSVTSISGYAFENCI